MVGFIRSDDFLAYDGVLTLIASAFEDTAFEAVFSDLVYVSQADTSRVIRHWSTGAFHPRRLKYGWMPAHPTLYLRRKVYERFGTYDKNMHIAADYDFILGQCGRTVARHAFVRPSFQVGGLPLCLTTAGVMAIAGLQLRPPD